MKTWAVVCVLAIGAVGLTFTPLVMMTSLMGSQRAVDMQLASSCTINTSDLTVDELDDEQLKNAGVIVAVGKDLGVPPRGLSIALAAAFQESTLRNLDHGDRDSLGLFQQRPSAGWGQPDQLTDPQYAARAFFGGPKSPLKGRGLLHVKGWEQMPLWEAAQRVQRSAFPTAYARWEGLAAEIVTGTADEASTCRTLAPGPWAIPLVDAYTLTSRFGGRTSPTTGRPDFHTGLDLAGHQGERVDAASAGVVSFAGQDGNYGNLIRIKHADGLETYYGHLSQIGVKEGQQVEAGQAIGEMGSTGNATGPHLHFEVRLNGEPTDPLTFLREKGLQP
jgi:murein DD-endopeptidase MepM/ murein hydrolase activator NlpD